MSAPVVAYVGLGANLGDPAAQIAAAVQSLATLPETQLLSLSSLYRSAPIDSSGPDYLNAVAALHTRLSPEALLAGLQQIEMRYGRERPYRNAPRTLDLDLLLHGNTVQNTPVLTLPHPRMQDRAFVLRPLAELAPELDLPSLGRLRELLPAVDAQRIERLDPSWRSDRDRDPMA